MIQVGRLRHRVTIQRLVAGSPQQDAGGAPDETWTDYATVWAEVAPLRGRELFAAQQVASEVSGTIRIRYRSDLSITSRMRCVFGARNYDILAVVDPMERHIEQILYVRELINSG